MLVLEQFLISLPQERQAWMSEHQPKDDKEPVIMLEDLEKELDETGPHPRQRCPLSSLVRPRRF